MNLKDADKHLINKRKKHQPIRGEKGGKPPKIPAEHHLDINDFTKPSKNFKKKLKKEHQETRSSFRKPTQEA